MAKCLDFRQVKKNYLTITLADENETTLMITSPTKEIMDDITTLQNAMNEINENEELYAEQLDDLYHVCARVMSRNKGGIKITAEHLATFFDFEDITIFFDAYMDFVSEITKQKN